MKTPNGKGLIFVFEEKGAKEFLDSISSTADEEITIVCANDEIAKKLSDLGYLCVTVSDYSQNASSELQSATDWMNKWSDEAVLNGKSFKELLVYGGVSIYWFIQTRFYFRMRSLIVLIERIKRILDQEKPFKVWVKGNEEVRYIVSCICGNHNLAGFEQVETGRFQSEVRYKSYEGHATLKLLLLKTLRGVFLSSTHSKKNSKGKILVVTEVSNWRKEFDYLLQRSESKDVLFHDIVRKLSAYGFDVVVVDFENRPRRLLNAYFVNKKRQTSFGVPVNPWEKYVNFDVIMKSRRAGIKLNRLWKQLQSSDDFARSLTYNGVSIYELVRKDVEGLLKSLKAHAAVTFIEAAKRIVEIEKPEVIIMHDEYGALQLSLINAAGEKGIPSVSIQHGLISEEQIAYVHETAHVSGRKRELLFPIPDKMCVWSERAKRNLIEISKFPNSVPVITGDPKIDFLPTAIKTFDHDKIIEKLGITRGKKIIMFATENLPSVEEKSLIARSVFDMMKALPQCHLIVKMHPNEADVSFYDKGAKQIDLRNYSIIRDANLYELLYISNLVILSYSTVAVEAMRMGKPVISLDIMGLHSRVPFIKNRKAIVVSSPEDLLPTVQKCLNDSSEIQQIIAEGKVFAEEELGAAEGKAAEQIVALVVSMAQESKKTALREESNIGS